MAAACQEEPASYEEKFSSIARKKASKDEEQKRKESTQLECALTTPRSALHGHHLRQPPEGGQTDVDSHEGDQALTRRYIYRNVYICEHAGI